MTINQSTIVEVYNSELEQWENITSGILSIDTTTGSDSFQGFWDQADTGQFVITSRGTTADPQLHNYIKSNALVNIKVNENTIFAGFITDVNVKYNKNDKQTVTINGTDLIGYLNRLVVTQEFIDTEITPTYPTGLVPVDYLLEVCTYALAPEIKSFFYIAYTSKEDFVQLTSPSSSPAILPTPVKVKVEPGKTLYELIATGMSSGLMRYECVDARQYYFMPYFKYDYSFFTPFWDDWYAGSFMYFAKTNEEDPWQADIYDFSTEITYKNINLSNGLDKMINQVTVNNTDPATQNNLIIDTVSDDASVTTYGPARLDGFTTFTTTSNPFLLPTSTIAGQAAVYQDEIIQYQSQPSTTIDYISIDMNKYYDSIYAPSNGSRIFVQHKLNNDEYITGYFVVSGVKNRITPTDWICELILRKSEHEIYRQNRPKTPTITLSATSGDTNDTFTASIGNYTSADWAKVSRIEWQVNYLTGLGTIPGSPPSEVNASWPTFTNNTVSWNYDDGGPLVGYPSEYIGPGYYAVAVWITNADGYVTSAMSEDISIIGATAHADFLFTKDASEHVTFIDNSGADTNTWSWNFGDGTTYSGKTPPKKIYAASGTYNVTLTVNNGFNTSTITKPITIVIYQLAVQFLRLRYQGTVTKPAGQADYTTDLIDTIGLIELMNTSNQQTGGVQPMYVQPKICDKVEDIGKGHIGTSVYTPVNRGSYIVSHGGFTSYDCYVPPIPAPEGQIWDDYDKYTVYVAAKLTRIDGTNTNTYTYYNGPSNNGVGATLTFPSAPTMIDGVSVSTITSPVKVLIVDDFIQDFNDDAGSFTNPYGGVYIYDPTTPTVMTRSTDFDEASDLNYDFYVEILNGNKTWKPYVGYPIYDFPEWPFVHYASNPTIGAFRYLNWPPYIPEVPGYTYQKRYYEDIVNGTTAALYGGYSPNYTTNYNSGGPLDPMSQSMRQTWNVVEPRGTFGGQYPKYKFHPVITNNPDGSQTKSIDVDLVIWYSQTYNSGTSSSSTSSAWRRYFNNQPAGLNATGGGSPTPNISYLPGGTPSRLVYWSNWGSGGSGFDERYKLKEVKVWPGLETTAFGAIIDSVNSSSGIGSCDTAVSGDIRTVISEFGVTPEKTYLPIEISVSEDGSLYRKIGEATYTGANVMSTTYITAMPPYSNAPIQT